MSLIEQLLKEFDKKEAPADKTLGFSPRKRKPVVVEVEKVEDESPEKDEDSMKPPSDKELEGWSLAECKDWIRSCRDKMSKPESGEDEGEGY